MTISILICDDLPEARATLHRYLRSYEQAHDVELDLETAADGAELLAMWRPGRWDMIFLDIFMPLIDGVEAARRLRKVDDKCEIVFATTSRQHGMEGYELHAMDYLTKPIAQQDVDDVMDWYIREKAEQRSELRVRTPEGEEIVRALDIRYIETRGHTCLIHTAEQTITVRRGIDELSAGLDGAFFRCHKSFLVNLRHVSEINRNMFLLDGGDSVPISAANVSRSKSALLAWRTMMS